jgi:fido (protein-threonine AMPylation protein)
MSKETLTQAVISPEAPVAFTNTETETYPGQIEWHRFADGNGRLYRLGLIELTDLAGERFLGGANSHYRLAVLLDVNGVGQAYPFKLGNGKDTDYLAPEYVHEKLGKALYFKQDTITFTQALARLLNRLTISEAGEEAAG